MGRYSEHAGIASLLLLIAAYYYAYDAQDQLTAATPAYYYAPETYAYDATGNRDAVLYNQTLRDYAVGPGNRIASDGVFTYSYDAEGNLIYRQSIADGSYTIYWYDYRNRILGTASCTAAGVNTSFSYFMYDAYDRLVRIWRDLDGVGATAATNTFFVHDGTSILFQFNGSRSQDLANRYLHAEAVDLVLADENLTTDKTHWMLTDHLGTIRHMVNFAYGAWQGARFGMQRAYDAFGQILAQGQPFDTIFAYTGQLLDKPTAMQYHQHRWYNPGIGRWMSEDPIGFEGGDVNLARYVGNSSTMLVDVNGLMPHMPPGAENGDFITVSEWRDLAQGAFHVAVDGLADWLMGSQYPSPSQGMGVFQHGAPTKERLRAATEPAERLHSLAEKVTGRPHECEDIQTAKTGVVVVGTTISIATGAVGVAGSLTAAPRAVRALDEVGDALDAATDCARRADEVAEGLAGGAARGTHHAPRGVPIPEGHTRVYRAVNEAEYRDILKHGQLRQGPNSLEGKWFGDSIEGARLHGEALEGAGNYRIIEVDVPDNAPSLFRHPNLDGRGPARYVDLEDLKNIIPRDPTGG